MRHPLKMILPTIEYDPFTFNSLYMVMRPGYFNAPIKSLLNPCKSQYLLPAYHIKANFNLFTANRVIRPTSKGQNFGECVDINPVTHTPSFGRTIRMFSSLNNFGVLMRLTKSSLGLLQTTQTGAELVGSLTLKTTKSTTPMLIIAFRFKIISIDGRAAASTCWKSKFVHEICERRFLSGRESIRAN